MRDDGLLIAPDAPTGRPLYLEVEAEGPYGLEVEAAGWAPADDALAPPVELELEVDRPDGFACAAEGTSLPGMLTIIDAGAEPLVLELRTASSDTAWQLRLEQVTVDLAPGESVVVPASVEIAPGRCADDRCRSAWRR